MLVSELLETMMVICFSTGWYGSIRQVWQAQDSRGVSRLMPAVVALGCLFGMGSKLALFWTTGYGGFVALLYAWNAVLSLAHLYMLVQFAEEVDGRRLSGVGPGDVEPLPLRV